MTKKEILKGLQHRIDILNETLEVIPEDRFLRLHEDYESRIDELESVYQWIKEGSN